MCGDFHSLESGISNKNKIMNSDSKKFFEPIANYAALRKVEEKLYHKPTDEEIRNFLDFWQDVYNTWKQNYSPFDPGYVEEKIKVRKMLIEKFGIRS